MGVWGDGGWWCLCRCAWWLGGSVLIVDTNSHALLPPTLPPRPPAPLPNPPLLLPLPNHPSPSPEPPVPSAHSVPMKVVEKGDHYILEVAATVKSVMEKWTQSVTDGDILGLGKGDTNKHIVAWQSKVGALTDMEERVHIHSVKVHWKLPH